MKKVLKICLAAIMVTSLLAQCVVMADPTKNYTTQTKYIGNDKIQVTTSVFGVEAGEEVTFLVKDKVEETEDEPETDEENYKIIFIDQMNTNDYVGPTEGGVTAQFSFVTAQENATSSATVEVGCQNSGKITPTATNSIVCAKGTVTYSVEGNGEVYVENADEAKELGTEVGYPGEFIHFYFAPAAGHALQTITENGESVGLSLVPMLEYEIKGDAELVFTFGAVESSDEKAELTDESDVTYPTGYQTTVKADEPTNNALTRITSIVNPSAAVEYGILVSKNSEAISADSIDVGSLTNAVRTDSDAVYKFAALGAYNGKFGVQLIDGGSGYLTGTIYTRTYVKSANQSCDFGKVETHNYN